MKKIVCFLALLAFVNTAQAEGPDAKRIYVGGGLGFNSLPGYGNANGFQFFGGYDFKFKINEDISTALEIGYMDSGSFDSFTSSTKVDDAKGLWTALVESVPVSSKVDILARLGYDFGDDDGVLLGVGTQYKFNTKAGLRMEYVARQHVNGLQANVYVKF